MVLILCPKCKDLKAIVGKKDGCPILDCAHVLTDDLNRERSEMAESIAITINQRVTDVLRKRDYRISRRHAEMIVAKDISGE